MGNTEVFEKRELDIEIRYPCCYYLAAKNTLLIFGGHKNVHIYSYNLNHAVLRRIGEIPYRPYHGQCTIKLDQSDDNLIIAGNEWESEKHYFYLYKISENRLNLLSVSEFKNGFDCHRIS